MATGSLHSQTLNWGSAVFSNLVDNNGKTMGDTFVFELGSFVNGFTPDDTNINDWLANWQVFDAATYNGIEEPVDDGIYGYFTSVVNMNADGTSDSPWQTPGATSFEGLDAYLWVRNSDLAIEGSEWLLTRADNWLFPTADPDCCGNGPPIEWSTSDLTSSNIPVWGSQGGITGGGIISNPGIYTLQSAAFVPEPSSFMLCMIAGILTVVRRRR